MTSMPILNATNGISLWRGNAPEGGRWLGTAPARSSQSAGHTSHARAAPFLLDLGPQKPPELGTGGRGKGGGPRPDEMVTSLPSLPTALWRERPLTLYSSLHRQ